MHDKIREAFEKWWDTPHEEDHIMNGIMKVEARYVWMAASAELEKQNEKMRCCGNCKRFYDFSCSEDTIIKSKCDNWELKDE